MLECILESMMESMLESLFESTLESKLKLCFYEAKCESKRLTAIGLVFYSGP